MVSTSIVFPDAIPTLRSPRLVLTSITEEDADHYFSFCSNPEVMRPWGTKLHQNLQETKNMIHFLNQEFEKKQMIRWGIREKDGGPLLGDIGFWRFVNPRLRAEIGAKLDPKFWTKG